MSWVSKRGRERFILKVEQKKVQDLSCVLSSHLQYTPCFLTYCRYCCITYLWRGLIKSAIHPHPGPICECKCPRLSLITHYKPWTEHFKVLCVVILYKQIFIGRGDTGNSLLKFCTFSLSLLLNSFPNTHWEYRVQDAIKKLLGTKEKQRSLVLPLCHKLLYRTMKEGNHIKGLYVHVHAELNKPWRAFSFGSEVRGWYTTDCVSHELCISFRWESSMYLHNGSGGPWVVSDVSMWQESLHAVTLRQLTLLCFRSGWKKMILFYILFHISSLVGTSFPPWMFFIPLFAFLLWVRWQDWYHPGVCTLQ